MSVITPSPSYTSSSSGAVELREKATCGDAALVLLVAPILLAQFCWKEKSRLLCEGKNLCIEGYHQASLAIKTTGRATAQSIEVISACVLPYLAEIGRLLSGLPRVLVQSVHTLYQSVENLSFLVQQTIAPLCREGRAFFSSGFTEIARTGGQCVETGRALSTCVYSLLSPSIQEIGELCRSGYQEASHVGSVAYRGMSLIAKILHVCVLSLLQECYLFVRVMPQEMRHTARTIQGYVQGSWEVATHTVGRVGQEGILLFTSGQQESIRAFTTLIRLLQVCMGLPIGTVQAVIKETIEMVRSGRQATPQTYTTLLTVGRDTGALLHETLYAFLQEIPIFCTSGSREVPKALRTALWSVVSSTEGLRIGAHALSQEVGATLSAGGRQSIQTGYALTQQGLYLQEIFLSSIWRYYLEMQGIGEAGLGETQRAYQAALHIGGAVSNTIYEGLSAVAKETSYYLETGVVQVEATLEIAFRMAETAYLTGRIGIERLGREISLFSRSGVVEAERWGNTCTEGMPEEFYIHVLYPVDEWTYPYIQAMKERYRKRKIAFRASLDRLQATYQESRRRMQAAVSRLFG